MGNPNKEGTLSNFCADAYEAAAKAAGHEVRRSNIGDLRFDPILHKGYRAIQELEPDLTKLQEDIRWCEHLVVVYPLWWSSMPALMKGMVDRMWLPGFGFRFNKMTLFGKTFVTGWQKLLKGRTARVIVLLKNHPFVERFMYGDYTAELDLATLRFSGIKVRVTEVGNSEGLTERQKERLGRRISSLARHGH